MRGTLLDGAGEPVPDGMVEIWQANAAGRYAHPADDRPEPALESGFLGFGRSDTAAAGRFEFLTVKPGPVPWPAGGFQAPHLEVGVFARGLLKRVVTRMYFPDEAEANAADPVLSTPRRGGPGVARRRPGGRRSPVRHPSPGPRPHDVLRRVSAFAPLFVPDELRQAVSGRAWLEAMLAAEGALARAGARAGAIPAAAAEAISAACVPDGLDWEQLLLEGRAGGAPVEPLVRALVARVGDENGRFVHLGATTQDVMDTAAMLVARQALGLVLAELDRVTEASAVLARAHRATPMAGRTLLQQAVPTTFGFKAAGWLVAVLDARARLIRLRDEGLAAQLGGAVGTLAALGERGPEIASFFAAELDLAEPTLAWHTNRVRVAELGAALDIAAGVLAKIALDVLLLAQTEVAEVREGGEGGSSSAMPQKRNAVGAMRTRAAAELAHAHASVLTGALVQEHERAAGAWQAEWEALSGVLQYGGGAAAALAGSLAGLEVDEGRMRANLDLTGGQIAAERIAVVLTERLGRTAARALVRSAALAASESGRSLAGELAELETGLSAEEIRDALEPTTYLGSASVYVDRALARHAAEPAGER